MLPALLTELADSYRFLPDLLAPTNHGPDPTGIRPPASPVSPAPINLDVSDLIRDISRWAYAWEFELAAAFWMPSPFWTRHRKDAVPLSLRWSARIIADPPQQQVDGYWMPGIVPDHIAVWIEDAASGLAARVRSVYSPPTRRRPLRAVEHCPTCGNRTLMACPSLNAVRCVTAGCDYEVTAAA